MTIEALKFLRSLVAQQRIAADDPNIVEIAATVRQVLGELDAEIAARSIDLSSLVDPVSAEAG